MKKLKETFSIKASHYFMYGLVYTVYFNFLIWIFADFLAYAQEYARNFYKR